MPFFCYSSCQSCFSMSLVERGPSTRTTQITLHLNCTKFFLISDYFKNIPQNVSPGRDFGKFWLWTGQYLHGTDPNAWLTHHSNFGRVWILT